MTSKIIDLRKVALELNSPLWHLTELESEQVLQVNGNLATTQKTGTAAYLVEDHFSKIALIGDVRRNYRMQADMRFLKGYKSLLAGGWFGFAIRAQDFLNYEIVWFMPRAEPSATAAYVPVAHGIVPWWTEAYATQKKGGPVIPADAWFRARVDVVGDEFTVYVEDQLVFTKKITYYIREGHPGLFVGTATDAAFRRISIEDLP